MNCKSCGEMLYRSKVEENLDVCPNCDEHFRIAGRRRIEVTLDEGTFQEIGQDLVPRDVLQFSVDGKSYRERLLKERKRKKTNDAVIIGFGDIKGLRCFVAVMDFAFLGGSMGAIVGEKVAVALETAYEHELPCVLFAASGGARMHEGALSLMQMAKTSAAVARHKTGGAPYIVVLTDPTTGGVTASFAALGDFTLAEPKALIGFAGPRVIQETIRSELPEGFQRSEFLLEHGFVDRIVSRLDMRDTIAKILEYCL
jgi:acetyl-CoA carboxylase carboxyl transferase subunit beta